MNQKPSVGRTVLYRPQATTGKEQYPAVITHVFSDTCVNLEVSQDGSYPLPDDEFVCGRCVTSVALSSDAVLPMRRSWNWPPRVEAANAAPKVGFHQDPDLNKN